MSEADEGTASSRIFLSNLTVYGGASAVLFVIFCLIRNRFPSLYNPRDSPSAEDEIRCEVATKRFGMLGWIPGVLSFQEDDLVEQCGLDAVCFLRVLKLGLKLAILGCFNALWLIPTYRSAEVQEENEHVVDWLDKLSVANVINNDPRLWGTLISLYMVCGAAMHLLHEDFKWYIKQRHRNLSKHLPQNYAIFVANIPPALRWEAALERYFNNIFQGKVLQIDMVLHVKELEKDVAARKKLVAKLEHELAVEGKTSGSRRRLFGKGGSEGLRRNVAELTAKINAQIEEVEARFSEREQRMEQLAEGFEEEEEDDDGPAPTAGWREADPLLAPERAGAARQVASAVKSVAKLAAAPPQVSDAAFVTFSSRQAATTAIQVLHHGKPHQLRGVMAPTPKDIFWNNIGLPHARVHLTTLLSTALTTVTCVFWTLPVAFASSLVQVGSLKERLPFLETAADSFELLDVILGLLGPVVLIVFMNLLPAILTAYCEMEGHVGRDALHASLFAKLAVFMLIQVFFVASVSGSLFKEIDDLASDPAGKIVEVLSSTLPTQSVFYMNYFLVKIVVGAALELLRVVPAVVAALHRALAPQLTDKERKSAWMGLKPLCCPGQFDEARPLATLVIVFVVLFVYMSLAPISAAVLALGFALELVVYSNQFVFVYDPSNDTGGKMWPKFAGYVVVCMAIAQVTILGYLGLKRGVMAPLVFPLLVCTLLFWQYLSLQHFRVAQTLPMPRCAKLDRRTADSDFGFVQGKYRQEALTKVSDDDIGKDIESATAGDNDRVHTFTSAPNPASPPHRLSATVHPEPQESPGDVSVVVSPPHHNRADPPVQEPSGAELPQVSQQAAEKGETPANLQSGSYAIEVSQGSEVKLLPVPS